MWEEAEEKQKCRKESRRGRAIQELSFVPPRSTGDDDEDGQTKKDLEKDDGVVELIIGVDEVGRGPLIGPVTICAVHLRHPELEAKDSKLWKTDRQLRRRDELVARWKKEHVFAVAWRSAKQIDEQNILRATMGAVVETVLAVRNAIIVTHSVSAAARDVTAATKTQIVVDTKSIIKLEPQKEALKAEALQSEAKQKEEKSLNKVCQVRVRVLVDGDRLPSWEEVAAAAPGGELDDVVWETMVGGDNVLQSIAAASMIAKQARDEYVLQSIEDPDGRYGFATNKGYGSSQHLRAIVQYGLQSEHRAVFTEKWLALHNQYRSMDDDNNDNDTKEQFLDRVAPVSRATRRKRTRVPDEDKTAAPRKDAQTRI
jgi:ribonuclease HII